MIVCKMTVCKLKICKMTVRKIIQFARLQATNENARNGKRTNLKKLPRPYKLPQDTLAESAKVGVKIGQTCLPPICPLCLPKVLKDGEPPQGYHLSTIGKEVSSQQM